MERSIIATADRTIELIAFGDAKSSMEEINRRFDFNLELLIGNCHFRRSVVACTGRTRGCELT